MRQNGLWWMIVIIIMLVSCGTEKHGLKQSDLSQIDVVENIGGAEPVYEPYNLYTRQDYSMAGRLYQIVQNPQHFSETGSASWYGEEAGSKITVLGELVDSDKFTAAHPVLPLPCYVRVTNLSNNRKIIVRVNDRGPYATGKVIDLSRAAAVHLDLANHSKIKIDFINVNPDGTLSGPGTLGITFPSNKYAPPAPPDIASASSTEIPEVIPAAPAAVQVMTR